MPLSVTAGGGRVSLTQTQGSTLPISMSSMPLRPPDTPSLDATISCMGIPSGAQDPAADDPPLSNLMQAMSLAVANGIKEGVRQALDAITQQSTEHKISPARTKRESLSYDTRNNGDNEQKPARDSRDTDIEEEDYFGDEDNDESFGRPVKSQGRVGRRDNNLLNVSQHPALFRSAPNHGSR